MGLLDDAIREHLDLKRRRGADPAEVERAEREALGPVRRAPEGQLSGALDEEPGVAYDHGASDLGYDDEAGELGYDHDPDDAGYDDEADAEESWSHDSRDETSPVADAPADVPVHDEPEFESESELAASELERNATPTPHPAHGPETAEFDVEQALEAEDKPGKPGKPGDEDVLEETPEFLQDTPDHDRLWFEQRPPKDFDFDG